MSDVESLNGPQRLARAVSGTVFIGAAVTLLYSLISWSGVGALFQGLLLLFFSGILAIAAWSIVASIFWVLEGFGVPIRKGKKGMWQNMPAATSRTIQNAYLWVGFLVTAAASVFAYHDFEQSLRGDPYRPPASESVIIENSLILVALIAVVFLILGNAFYLFLMWKKEN